MRLTNREMALITKRRDQQHRHDIGDGVMKTAKQIAEHTGMTVDGVRKAIKRKGAELVWSNGRERAKR